MDEILKKYEEEETEEVSGSVSEIPDDTVDEIMRKKRLKKKQLL